MLWVFLLLFCCCCCFSLWISYFTDNSILGHLCVFGRSLQHLFEFFLFSFFNFKVTETISITKSSSSITVLQLNIIFPSQHGLFSSLSWQKNLALLCMTILAENKDFIFIFSCSSCRSCKQIFDIRSFIGYLGG